MSDTKPTNWTFTSDGKSIQIPDGIGKQAAEECAKTYAEVDKIRKKMVADGLTTTSPLSNLPSGQALAIEYTNSGLVAYAILNEICDILTGFGDAFIWSEKTYKAADDAAAEFLKMRNNATAGTKVSNPHKYATPTADDLTGTQQSYSLGQKSIPQFKPKDTAVDQWNKIMNKDYEHYKGHGTKAELGLSQWESYLRTFSKFKDNVNDGKVAAWKTMATNLSDAMTELFTKN